MRLAFCLFKYYPFGGLERDFQRIAIEAQKRQHSITVYTMSWEGEIPTGFSVVIVPVKGFGNHARCVAFIQNLASYLRKEQFDLVIGFNRMPDLDVYYAADICYVAHIYTKYGSWYRLLPRYRTYSALEQAVFNPSAKTKILLLDSAEKQVYQKYYQTPADRFHLLPPGIDRHRLAMAEGGQIRVALRKELKISEDKFLLLMVGSDFRRKGVDRTLRAMAVLPKQLRSKTVLVIIGSGKIGSLFPLVQLLGLQKQVLFLGARHDVGRFMVAADLLLHPAYYETAGMVLLEALVAGLPVLVTENCGYAFHIAQAKAGMVVPMPYKQKTFNEFLVTMLTSAARPVWQQNAKTYAANTDLYSLPERAVDLLEQFYQEKFLHKNTELYSYDHGVKLNPVFNNFWRKEAIFSEVFNTQGKIYRHEKNRKTLRFEIDANGYFIKLHQGVGWKEIFKNLLQGRWPVLGAQREWQAIQRLKQIGVPTMDLLGYGQRGWNPAKLESFVVTAELMNTISLEDYCKDWSSRAPSVKLKRMLITEVARIAHLVHSNGINHRDFYICHFLLDKNITDLKLYLIDLHRMQFRRNTPRRWLVKDIAGLYFSSMDLGLTKRDLLWFMKHYTQQALAITIRDDLDFWCQVAAKANKLYSKVNRTKIK